MSKIHGFFTIYSMPDYITFTKYFHEYKTSIENGRVYKAVMENFDA
jgi:hypothetical protein